MKFKIRYLGGSGLFLATWLLIFFLSRADNSLMTGTGQQEITPKEPMPMWGYASRHDALSQGILDPLYARALVIQADGQKVAIVSLDLGRTPVEKRLMDIRHHLKSEAGIDHSFIVATHTHHGPVLELSDEAGKGKGRFDAAVRYPDDLEKAIVRAVAEANGKLKRAKMAVGTAPLKGFNFNRQTTTDPAPSVV
jgi:hypothetical protein